MSISDDDRRDILTMSLTNDTSCMMLAGYLHAELENVHGITAVTAEQLFRALVQYRTMMPELMDRALQLHAAGIRRVRPRR